MCRKIKQAGIQIGVDEMKDGFINACKYIEQITGSCPFDMHDYLCSKCEHDCDNDSMECWMEYFINEEENEWKK